MPQVFYNSIEIGDPIPTLQKPPISRTQIARFAAASGDYGPLHVDDEVARTSGYGSVFAHGMVAMAYVGEMLSRWLDNGRVAQLQCKFLRLVWPGDVLSAKGVVVPKQDDGRANTVVCDVWVQNQNNDRVLMGRAICVMFASPEEQKKSGKQRPDPVYLANEYQSPNRKADKPSGVGGPADKPPPRPPPKAAGTPVQLSAEALSELRKKPKAAAPATKAAGKSTPPPAAKAAGKSTPPPVAKTQPPKAAASKSQPPKAAPASKAPKAAGKSSPPKAAKAPAGAKAPKAAKPAAKAPAKDKKKK